MWGILGETNLILLIPETEEQDKQDSDSDEDNIPFSQIQALKATRKTEIPQLERGEACIGNLI
jgi:hypothetical protein